MFALGVLEGDSPKADRVREVAWIYSTYCISSIITKCGQGEGVKNPRNYADVLYVWSPR